MTEYSGLLDCALKAVLGAGSITLKYYRKDMDIAYKDDNSPLTNADLESDREIRECLKDTGIPILSEEESILPWIVRKNWERFWLIDPLDGTKEFIQKRDEYTINIALVENTIPVVGVVYAPALDVLYYGIDGEGSYRVSLASGIPSASMVKRANRILCGKPSEKLRIIASRSHDSEETGRFIERLKRFAPAEQLNPIGSSLKLCRIAEGGADIYPRFGPTMEWDTAAAQAVVHYAGGLVTDLITLRALTYNKKDLHNPEFIAYNSELDPLLRRVLNIE